MEFDKRDYLKHSPSPAVTVVALEWWKSITFSKSALRNHHLPSV
ncbi:hypothetical protein MDA_GLEAN10001193 [Myotis davidii]|uniref:Uncharacterized protein n=1 Tax=Myotis davidii TaxID=225400 RepID=L5LST0_MYODS|nr:hypothetical protein MDA_GLEAN10001193 [Myotis davidii]